MKSFFLARAPAVNFRVLRDAILGFLCRQLFPLPGKCQLTFLLKDGFLLGRENNGFVFGKAGFLLRGEDDGGCMGYIWLGGGYSILLGGRHLLGFSGWCDTGNPHFETGGNWMFGRFKAGFLG